MLPTQSINTMLQWEKRLEIEAQNRKDQKVDISRSEYRDEEKPTTKTRPVISRKQAEKSQAQACCYIGEQQRGVQPG